ncbi:MAG: hypothetical protein A2675_03795 [Candidatus Yonathbacteria bacterium RIFCSPHIGHO2_01_FULL_51_10]|uniref:Uncharacterized protein n=1 Tax=Candidatus Yonathbacteria bacterium RIFCSPHIGHO2_01_FULL_51_10 TaxID=1802723 RepID=A0A1G2S569_9BACT|nr:MAG: hypothetical protein A2675_03795 [Candidatus Yonathbacteria bacterium RIFCSPHIGHO2_01_FULL_51_10]
MHAYALKLIPPEDHALFTDLTRVVRAIPDANIGIYDNRDVPIHCHVLTRALNSVFPMLEVRDGFVSGAHYEHSWLVTSSGHIIDPCPIAMIGGPIMVDGDIPLWQTFYSSECCFLHHHTDPFVSWVNNLTKVVVEAHEQLRKTGAIN